MAAGHPAALKIEVVTPLLGAVHEPDTQVWLVAGIVPVVAAHAVKEEGIRFPGKGWYCWKGAVGGLGLLAAATVHAASVKMFHVAAAVVLAPHATLANAGAVRPTLSTPTLTQPG